MTHVHRMFCFAFTAFMTVAIAQTAHAKDEPLPPLRLMVPCKLGSPNDLLARIVAQSLSERSGRKVIVENTATRFDMPTDEHSAVFKVLDCDDENGMPETTANRR